MGSSELDTAPTSIPMDGMSKVTTAADDVIDSTALNLHGSAACVSCSGCENQLAGFAEDASVNLQG